jgi:hypothetical protein
MTEVPGDGIQWLLDVAGRKEDLGTQEHLQASEVGSSVNSFWHAELEEILVGLRMSQVEPGSDLS